jgi:hypothetical protein
VTEVAAQLRRMVLTEHVQQQLPTRGDTQAVSVRAPAGEEPVAKHGEDAGLGVAPAGVTPAAAARSPCLPGSQADQKPGQGSLERDRRTKK